MTKLSPAALAVWEAFNQEPPTVFVDYGECLAAALRAAVDYTKDCPVRGVWQCDADEILAIADELEAQ